MDPRVVVHVLRTSDVLGRLPEGLLEEIGRLAVTVRHPAGGVVVRQGEPAEALYIVSTGLLRVVLRGDDGGATTLNTLGPGTVFGELGLLDMHPRSSDVVAVRDTVLLRVARAPFVALVRARPDLALALLQGLAGRVRALSRSIGERGSASGRVRLARHLLRVAELRGVEGPEGVELREHLPQAVLASSVGLGRQAVNRLLQELQDEGILQVRRARILVLDRAHLAVVAGS